MIHIQVINESPFQQHPQLLTIWPEPSNTVMQEGIHETLEIMKNAPDIDVGMISLILKDNEVIGLSGFFPINENEQWDIFNPYQETIYLRWHGIIPSHRGQDYSKQALILVLEEAIKKYPFVEHIIELIPQTSYKEYLEKHFIEMGFKPVGEKEKYSWSEYWWQPHQLNIKEFFNKQNSVVYKNLIR